MQTSELVVWSAMLGGLTTLAAFALADALIRRSMASWRACVYVALTGTACLLLTGLVPALLPDLSLQIIHMLQNSMGLLSGALALNYLGLWMGVGAEDRIVRNTIIYGSTGLVLAACTMAVLTLLSPEQRWRDLLLVTAVINALSVLLPAIASARAVYLGDLLARGIFGSTALLAVVVFGLYARGLEIDLGIVVWTLTAICTVGFFMLGTYMGLRRDRMNRKLERLAGLAQGNDPATGLPKGSVLISKIDDAFWRSGRKGQQCTVICLHLRNLYQLADAAGHNADKQILSAMSARMRRAVGFRNVVGLYHPRCFVVVISTDSQSRLVEKLLQRLHYLMAKPLHVMGPDFSSHVFVPRFGIGAVAVTNQEASPAAVIDQAEGLAVAADPDSEFGFKPVESTL